MRNLIKQPIKTLFLGTDWESLETLKTLNKDNRFNLIGVITSIDKPVGRKQIQTPSKVKVYAQKNDIRVFHTQKSKKKYKEALNIFKPELIVCKAFGEILPKFFIEYPKYKSINIHFSILPKYRGAVPIQKAILDGEKKTGISIMLMSDGLDEGDVLKIFKEPIYPYDTNLSLRRRLVKKSSEVLGDILELWIYKKIEPSKQNHSKATYCWQRDISKRNAQIKWENMEPEYIERLIRAMIPWPIAWTVLEKNKEKSLDNLKMQIIEAKLINTHSDLLPGTLFSKNGYVLFSTNNLNTCLEIKRFKLQGKKETNEKDFLNGLGKILLKF
jgi:methionyl-tRNA formyltransferase